MEASPLFLCQSKFGQDPYCGSGTSHISAFAARGTSGRHLGFEEFQIFFQCFQRLMLAFFSFFLVNSFSSLYISIVNRFFRDFVVAKMPFDVIVPNTANGFTDRCQEKISVCPNGKNLSTLKKTLGTVIGF